jgi:hypothetical protein
MRQRAALVVLTAALAGCSSSKPKPEPSARPLLRIELPEYFYSAYTTLYVNGREFARMDRYSKDKPLVIHLPAQPPPRLTAKIEDLCATRQVEVSLSEKFEPQAHLLPAHIRPMVASLGSYSAPNESIQLWVVNRGRPTAKLRVGRQERVIAEDEVTHFNLLYDLCPAAREAYLDDKLVGMLPEKIPDPKDGEILYDPLTVKYSHEVLLDTSGKGCYVYTEYCYKKKGYEWCSGPESRTYRGKHLHRIPGRIDYLLEKPPKEIQVSDSGGYDAATRAGLRDCGAR